MSPRRSPLADLQRERDLFQQENHRLLVEAMALRATIARLLGSVEGHDALYWWRECQRLRAEKAAPGARAGDRARRHLLVCVAWPATPGGPWRHSPGSPPPWPR